jgi:SAM-dependent methyltransferase
MGCVDCAAPGVRVPWSSDAYPLARCTGCGLVFYAEWEQDFSVGAAFHPGNIEYYEQMESDAHAVDFNPTNLARTRQVLVELGQMAPTRSLLDVGCGRGEAVAAAASGGWLAEGIDLAPGAIRIARSHGLSCSTTDFFDPSFDERRFGVIVMSEFIEHVPAPSRFLRRAHVLLEEGGLLYVTTPNFGSFGRRRLGAGWNAIGPGHVAYFTKQRLLDKARSAGFEHVSTRTGGISIAAVRTLTKRPSYSLTPVSREEQYVAVELAREAIYSSRWARAAKRLLDPAIGVSGLGETLKTIFRRPHTRQPE